MAEGKGFPQDVYKRQAVALVSLDQRNNQRNKKAKQAQPGKQDVEESQNQIGKGCNPEIVVPVFFLFHGFTS